MATQLRQYTGSFKLNVLFKKKKKNWAVKNNIKA